MAKGGPGRPGIDPRAPAPHMDMQHTVDTLVALHQALERERQGHLYELQQCDSIARWAEETANRLFRPRGFSAP